MLEVDPCHDHAGLLPGPHPWPGWTRSTILDLVTDCSRCRVVLVHGTRSPR